MSGLLGGLPVTNADDLAVAFWQHVVRSRASHHVCGKSAAISIAIHIAADLAMVSRLSNSMASRWSGLGNTRHQRGEVADTMLLGVVSSHEGPALEPMRCVLGFFSGMYFELCGLAGATPFRCCRRIVVTRC